MGKQDLESVLSGVTRRFRSWLSADSQIGADEVQRLLRRVREAESGLAAIKSRVIRAAQQHQSHRDAGVSDTGALLRGTLGLTSGQAREQARTASSLESLPGTERALADGRVGQAEADLIARAARRGRIGGPAQTEQVLLGAADRSQSVEDFRDQIKRCEHRADPAALAGNERRGFDRRDARQFVDRDGMVNWNLKWDPVSNEYWATAVNALSTLDPADGL